MTVPPKLWMNIHPIHTPMIYRRKVFKTNCFSPFIFEYFLNVDSLYTFQPTFYKLFTFLKSICDLIILSEIEF